MKQIFLMLVFSASLSALFAQDTQKEKQELREEQRAQVRESKEALQTARASGDKQAVKEAKERLRSDKQELHQINKECRKNHCDQDRKRDRDRDRKQDRDKQHGQSNLNEE